LILIPFKSSSKSHKVQLAEPHFHVQPKLLLCQVERTINKDAVQLWQIASYCFAIAVNKNTVDNVAVQNVTIFQEHKYQDKVMLPIKVSNQ
jgi:hypothetical protein